MLKTIGKLREKSAREKAEKAGVPLKKGQPVVPQRTRVIVACESNNYEAA